MAPRRRRLTGGAESLRFTAPEPDLVRATGRVHRLIRDAFKVRPSLRARVVAARHRCAHERETSKYAAPATPSESSRAPGGSRSAHFSSVPSPWRVPGPCPASSASGKALGMAGFRSKDARTRGPWQHHAHAASSYDETGDSTRGPLRRVRLTRSRPRGGPQRPQAIEEVLDSHKALRAPLAPNRPR